MYDSIENYVTCIQGDFPLIICSPHGGYIDVKKIPTRKEYKDCGKVTGKCHKNIKSSFVTQNDGPMTEIAHYVYVNICNITKKRPYMVINNIRRKDIDMNRDLEHGTEHSHSEEIWHHYFDCIDNAIAQIKKKHSNPLLIDLHAYEKRPKNDRDIISVGYGLKSKDLKKIFSGKPYQHHLLTIPDLFKGNIKDLMFGKKSFGSILQRHGLNTFPSYKYQDLTKIKKFSYYSGGYTVRRFKDKISSIQIELSEDYTDQEKNYAVSKILANSIVIFLYEIHNIPTIIN